MAYVNPYLNTYGWGLTVTKRNNTAWVSETLQTANTIISEDALIGNIWDPINRRLVAWSGNQQNISTGQITNIGNNPVWNIPDPNQAGDINRVNVIINNTSDNPYFVWNLDVNIGDLTVEKFRSNIQMISPEFGSHNFIPANESVGVNLRLGRNHLIPLPTNLELTTIEQDLTIIEEAIIRAITSGIVVNILPSTATRIRRNIIQSGISQIESDITKLIFSFQIFPVPDQVISIDNSITINSPILNPISRTNVTIHNCFSSMMYVKQRPCNWVSTQNMAFIPANSSLTLQVYTGYQLFLQTPDSTVVSAIMDKPRFCSNRTVYFKNNGRLSTQSCTGREITSCISYIPVPLNNGNSKSDKFSSWWGRWWWAVLITVVVIIILIVILIYVGRKPPTVEVY